MRCLVKCVLGISDLEAEIILKLIVARRPLSVLDVAKLTGRSRSYVQRALLKLTRLEGVRRRPLPLVRGGRRYLYEAGENLVRRLMRNLKGVHAGGQAATNLFSLIPKVQVVDGGVSIGGAGRGVRGDPE